jgi:hypothetical protein
MEIAADKIKELIVSVEDVHAEEVEIAAGWADLVHSARASTPSRLSPPPSAVE